MYVQRYTNHDFYNKVIEFYNNYNMKHFLIGTTLGPSYNEFCYKHPLTTRRFLCINITDSNVKKFGYSTTSTLLRRTVFFTPVSSF